MNKMITRAYNKIILHPHGILEKASASERLMDEIAYYNALPPHHKIHFPRIIDSNSGQLYMEQYMCSDLGKHIIQSDDILPWHSIFQEIKSILSLWDLVEEEWFPILPEDILPSIPTNDTKKICAWKMYIDKTEFEYDHLKTQFGHTNELFTSPTVTINGNVYHNFHVLWGGSVREWVVQRLVNTVSSNFGIIHGDMCLSNILYLAPNCVRFIDPRGSFGERGIYGDTRYDIAKLQHSVNGKFDIFNHDLFILNGEGCEWNIQIEISSNYSPAQKAFNDIMFSDGKFHSGDISLIEALLFISAAGRHYENRDRQIALYLTGVRLLSNIVQGIRKEIETLDFLLGLDS